MTEARKKQAKRKKVVKAAKERIENVEAEEVGKGEATLTVPFALATKLNQATNMRRSQNIVRKQLYTYITTYFTTFVTSMQKIEDNALYSRLFIEVLRIVVPRPKEYEDDGEFKNKIANSLFGKPEVTDSNTVASND